MITNTSHNSTFWFSISFSAIQFPRSSYNWSTNSQTNYHHLSTQKVDSTRSVLVHYLICRRLQFLNKWAALAWIDDTKHPYTYIKRGCASVRPLPFDPKKCYFRFCFCFHFSGPLLSQMCYICLVKIKSSPKVKHDLT